MIKEEVIKKIVRNQIYQLLFEKTRVVNKK